MSVRLTREFLELVSVNIQYAPIVVNCNIALILGDFSPLTFSVHRKFADIGSTVKHQVGAGVFAVAEWADLVTVHAIPGAGILQALREACQSRTRPLGCVLVAEMSSEGNLITEEYTKCEL